MNKYQVWTDAEPQSLEFEAEVQEIDSQCGLMTFLVGESMVVEVIIAHVVAVTCEPIPSPVTPTAGGHPRTDR